MNSYKFTAKLGDDEVTIETGKLAQQAGGAVTVREGDTVLLVTATMSHSVREGIDFFPLTGDQLTMLLQGNTCDQSGLDELGIDPQPFDRDHLAYLN